MYAHGREDAVFDLSRRVSKMKRSGIGTLDSKLQAHVWSVEATLWTCPPEWTLYTRSDVDCFGPDHAIYSRNSTRSLPSINYYHPRFSLPTLSFITTIKAIGWSGKSALWSRKLLSKVSSHSLQLFSELLFVQPTSP